MKIYMRFLSALALLSALSACSSSRVYKVKGLTGEHIQAQIDRASSQGGGKVVVPAGTYNVGSIRLRSNVELHLEKDAVLLGGTKSECYDSFPEEVCSIRPEKSSKVMVYAFNENNIAITGKGVIDAQGPAFFDTLTLVKGYFQKPAVERPRMVQFVNCEGVRLEGVTFKDSPCWTMLIRMCRDIDINAINVTADQRMINNDGIDFDGCSHVRLRNSSFKTCDDCLVLRAMREFPEQHVVCEDIVVENCSLNSSCQAVRLGCPSDDTIRNARFNNIIATGNNGIFADFPVRYLGDNDEGYVDITDIVFDSFSGSFRGSALQIISQPGVKPRRVDGLVFRNFSVSCDSRLKFIGNKGYEIGNVSLENFVADVRSPKGTLVVRGCNGLEFKNVIINGQICPDGVCRSPAGAD